jgi:hypothetical protein
MRFGGIRGGFCILYIFGVLVASGNKNPGIGLYVHDAAEGSLCHEPE